MLLSGTDEVLHAEPKEGETYSTDKPIAFIILS
jgi:hypothetical protein